MSWLHTWSGLLVGWVLFFMFVTGTFGYLNAEVDRWMRPELPLPEPARPAAALLPAAQARLQAQAADAESWSIHFPGGRGEHHLTVAWRSRAPRGADPEAARTEQSETLDLQSGAPLQHQARETGGGGTLYRMHYRLHYLPEAWSEYIVGICTSFLLVALVSGVIIHKKIFRDFFTFRPGKGQRSWLDGHNLLSVTALPFHLMITWSGLVFFAFTYLPAPLQALYPTQAAQQQFEREAYGREPREPSHRGEDGAAALAPLAPMLAKAAERWGQGYRTASLQVSEPGRTGARVSIWSTCPRVVGSSWAELRFDGVSGRVLSATAPDQGAAETFRRTLFNLHEAHFSGPLLRLLYVLSSLAGAAMIATGLLLWSSKRTAKLKQDDASRRGIVAVDVLNAGTLIGLPIGIAAYFIANRLLPASLEGRADWEVHALFLTWATTFPVALWRQRGQPWRELCWVAAGAYAALPLINALTTERHLGVTLAAGDWVLAGFDLSALGVAVFFALLACWAGSKTHKAEGRAAAVPARRSLPAAGVG